MTLATPKPRRVRIGDSGARRFWRASTREWTTWARATAYSEARAESVFDSIPGAVGTWPIGRT